MWKENDNVLSREFQCKDFSEAMAFVMRVALISEVNAHHPEIRINYNRVWLGLCTHDAGDVVTSKDHALAAEIDKISP
jgi:4a-hydroxytetrahydrobiopterin dehydratase